MLSSCCRRLPLQVLGRGLEVQNKCIRRASSTRLYSHGNVALVRSQRVDAARLDSFKHSFSPIPATHAVGDLSSDDIGKQVIIHGYLGSRVDLSKSISFSTILDASLRQSVQIISNSKAQNGLGAEAHASLKNQSSNSPVVITGTVQKKEKPKGKPQDGEVPSSQASGPVSRNEVIEILLNNLQVLNTFPSTVTMQPDTVIPSALRHLQLRQSHELRHALSFRARTAKLCRDLLSDEFGFREIETPMLFKSTPEGAREFLVPTRKEGFAYALPQSPQQYKQILMASGIPRYFQIARCFRDEDLRADRQPEFTQLDLEMAFAIAENVMEIIEKLIRRLWATLLGHDLPETPFQIMPYEEAMSRYGSDKPDTRLGMEIMRVGHMVPPDLVGKIGSLKDPIVEVMKLSISNDARETREFTGKFMDSTAATPFLENPDGQPGIFIYDPRAPLGGLQPFGFEAAEQIEESLRLEEGDMLILQARPNAPFSGGSTAMGRLRLALHKAAVTHGYAEEPTGWSFLWINRFPLFSPSGDGEPGQGGEAGLSSTHHPFTAPASLEDIDHLSGDPLQARADHYDLVLNGVELGGGSRRIHDARLQEYILRDVLKVSEERMRDFKHLLDVLGSGCPPHAGIALGFDRLCAVMLGKESIRDVIAFPKSGQGEDLLVKSPSPMTPEQLATYHLRLKR